MRVLLISYEFPPIESAQALRWQYLAEHLVALGLEITVIAPEIIKNGPASDALEKRVIRSYPGPFVGISGWLSNQFRNGFSKPQSRTAHLKESKAELVYRMLRKGLDKIIFPDIRSEWYPFAGRSFAHFAPGDIDLVIASHEPGVDLMLGLKASRYLKAPLVVDLADPLVTPYSPSWRKRWDTKLERMVSQYSSGVITTSAKFSRLLVNQYHIPEEKVIEIEQGFEVSQSTESVERFGVDLPKNQFWLLFTGNFYQDFRNPMCIVEALQKRPGIKFIFAGSTPEWLLGIFRPLGDQIICLGRLSHQEVIGIQKLAPVLVNLGNQQSIQVPGKLYEYFGASRPILHVALNSADPSGALLEGLRRGIGTTDDVDHITQALDKMQSAFAKKSMSEEWDLKLETVEEYSWHLLSQRLLVFLKSRISK